MTIAKAQWDAIAKLSRLRPADEAPVPKPVTFEEHVAAAKAFRAHVERECSRKVCSVCSRYRRSCDVFEQNLADVKGLDLLDVSGPQSLEHPRDALTTWSWDGHTYCLQKEGCRDCAGVAVLDICKECHHDMEAGRIPTASLVNIDTGGLAVLL